MAYICGPKTWGTEAEKPHTGGKTTPVQALCETTKNTNKQTNGM